MAKNPLQCGLEELDEFIRDVGAGKIGQPIVKRTTVYVPLTARDGEQYVLQIVCDAYLTTPPRCTFVDSNFQVTPAAWPHPHPSGPFRSPAFICTPPIAEFYAAHPSRVYRPGEGSLVNTVATVFAALHAPAYRGRWIPGSADASLLRRRRR